MQLHAKMANFWNKL